MEAFIDDFVQKGLRFARFSDLLGWNTTPNGVSWNIFGDHGTGRDYSTLSDCGAGKYRYA
jgi:hypothetical protein